MEGINMPHKQTQDERFGSRLTSQEKAILQQAADLEGRTLTDFVMSSAHERAIKVIKEHEQINLSRKDSQLFIHALLNPREPAESLKHALKHYLKDVDSE
jgi:uncharacterized protein (DUF1778 family)